jgi:uncharacterized protein (TIGR02145 family)
MKHLKLKSIVLIALVALFFSLNGCQKEPLNFQTKNFLSTDSLGGDSIVIDYDGNIYEVIKIGDQYWMTENLRVTHYNDGTPIPCIVDSCGWALTYNGAYSIYNNDSVNSQIYGLLYNWYTVNTGMLAPEGWRIPSDEDWKKLEFELGLDSSSYYVYGFRGENEGSKLAGYSDLWVDGELEMDSSFATTKFNGLPSGRRYWDGTYDFINQGAYWWSSTEQDEAYAYRRHIWYDLTSISRTGADKHIGFPVRCIKNTEPNDHIPSPYSSFRGH